MEKKSTPFVESMCKHLAENERETIAKLGEEKASFFLRVADDCFAIGDAIIKADLKSPTLLSGTFLGLPNEIYWLQFLFVSANYPLLLSRLRHVWESVARAYFAENYSAFRQKWTPPGPTADDKITWLDERENKNHLRWDTCIEPVIQKVFPEPNEYDKETFTIFHVRWKYLHRYAHPSAYVINRKLDSDSIMINRFDEKWALLAIETAAFVFDLIWLTALAKYPEAARDLGELKEKYPLLCMALGKLKKP